MKGEVIALIFCSMYFFNYFIYLDLKLDLERLHAAYDDVDAMLLFIGYPRSRHTLVSALLDAHPNIMLSNEFNLIGSYKKNPEWSKNQVFDKMAKMSYFSAIRGSRAQTTNGNASNYVHLGYKVPNQWQGTFDRTLKVYVNFVFSIPVCTSKMFLFCFGFSFFF